VDAKAPPSALCNVAVVSHAEYVHALTAAAALRVKAALSKAACVTLTFDVLVACDAGYLYADFGLSGSLCSRLRPDVRDRQTDVRRRQTKSLNASAH